MVGPEVATNGAGRIARHLAVAGAAAILAGCTHYAPAPPHPELFPAAYDARRLDEKPPGSVWTGADLLAAALARNPAVAEAAAKYRAAVRGIKVAKTPPNATLTLTAEWAKEKPTWGHGAAADIPLDIGGRRSTRITQAELQALQALYDYQQAAWTVRTALAKARAELVSADAEVALATEVAALRRERSLRLERRVAAGEDDRFLYMTSRTELNAAERRVADARGRRDAAVAALAKALGVSPPAVQDLKLAPPPGAPPLGAIAPWRNDAALSRRDVLRAVADYDLAENALRLEVAKQYPDIRLGPGYMWDHGVLKLPFNLALTLPPPDLNRASIRQAEATRAAAGRSLETVQANALAAVDQAEAALAVAQANVERTRRQDIPTAQRVAADTARSLRAGAADRVEELAARAAVGDAQLNLLDAERAYRTATADLEDALHRTFDPAEATVMQAQMDLRGDAR